MKLMEPGKIGAVTLKNRIVMTPMGMFGVPSPDGSLTARGMEFYLERAKGGTALIFPAAALVTTEFESPCSALNAFDSMDKVMLWSELAEQVHHHGAKLGIQLSAGLGRTTFNYFFDPEHVPVSASAVPSHWTPWITCRPLTVEEISRIVQAFAAGHEPFLGALADHPVRIILEGSGEQAAAVHGGFVQMSGTSLVVLSDLAELKENIDKGRAEHAKRVAEEALAKNPDDEDAAAALARAETRLAVAG